MIRGYERQITYLERVRARGRLAHAYLFYGPDRCGILAIAKSLIKGLYCPNYGGETSLVKAGDGCRECAAVDADTHPAVILLDLEHSLTSEKETRKKIPIDDIHELRRRFSLAAAGGAWRVAIVHHADTMSEDARDAFLKLLEEPGAQTLFILITDARESVSPTIRSRAVPLGFFGGDVAGADDTMKGATRIALSSGIPEALALSERIAGDAAARTAAIRAVLDLLRARIYAARASGDRVEAARRISRVLDIAAAAETTNVNARLAMDAIFLESMRTREDAMTSMTKSLEMTS